MKIKTVTVGTDQQLLEGRIHSIFKSLGAVPVEHHGQQVLKITNEPDIMNQKVEIAYELLKRLGYDRIGQSMKHFWYIKDKQGKLPTISIESQGKEGFVTEKHDYLVWWD